MDLFGLVKRYASEGRYDKMATVIQVEYFFDIPPSSDEGTVVKDVVLRLLEESDVNVLFISRGYGFLEVAVEYTNLFVKIIRWTYGKQLPEVFSVDPFIYWQKQDKTFHPTKSFRTWYLKNKEYIVARVRRLLEEYCDYPEKRWAIEKSISMLYKLLREARIPEDEAPFYNTLPDWIKKPTTITDNMRHELCSMIKR